jgi:hypothetical protein
MLMNKQIYMQARNIHRSCKYCPGREIYRIPAIDRFAAIMLAASCRPMKVDSLVEKSNQRKNDAEWKSLGFTS